METWYRSDTLSEAIQEEFGSRWLKVGGKPLDAAVLYSHNFRTKVTTCYISPSMARLAPDLVEACQATACQTPELSRLILLVGDQSIAEGED